MTIIPIIQKIALFQGVSPEIIQEMAEFCPQKSFPKGKQLFAAGDKADAFFVIVEGWVKLFRISRDGEEAVIHVFGPGESFAEAAVFNDRKMYPVNAQAVEKVALIEIPRSFLIRKIEHDSQFALRMLASISARQHYLVQQLEQISTRTAPQRIGAFLIQFCKKRKEKNGEIIVDLPYDKSIISTRLNIKPETFSRALTKLEPYGVHSDGRTITIHDLTKLTEFCDVSLQETPC